MEPEHRSECTVRWSERRTVSKVILLGAILLIAVGLVLGVAAAITGYWAGLGGAATLTIGGGVAYWLATHQSGGSSTGRF